MTAPEPVEVAADELAAAEAVLRRGWWYEVTFAQIATVMAEYDRLDEMCDVFEARWNEARADLARALPVVEAAGAVVTWCAENNDEVPERLLDALARAYRAAREPRTGERT
jgi:hypothetical protein